MFRPNRIGTPYIMDVGGVDNTSAFTISTQANSSAFYAGNVINAIPVGDYGRSHLHWAGAARTLPASNKWCIGQQFTVTPPIGGDVVGVEVSGSINIPLTSNTGIMAFLGKLTEASSGVLDDFATAAPMLMPITNGGVSGLRTPSYKEQVIIRDVADGVGGTYVHGFVFLEGATTPAAQTFAWFDGFCSIRQLNDQQDIGYRDTLR